MKVSSQSRATGVLISGSGFCRWQCSLQASFAPCWLYLFPPIQLLLAQLHFAGETCSKQNLNLRLKRTKNQQVEVGGVLIIKHLCCRACCLGQ